MDHYVSEETRKLARALVLRVDQELALGDVYEVGESVYLVWEDNGTECYIVEPVTDREGTVEVFKKSTAAYVELPCFACQDKGYLLADIDSTGKLVIQRCDSCSQFNTDNDAVKYVFDAASNGGKK